MGKKDFPELEKNTKEGKQPTLIVAQREREA
jgi:hypothetical protein